MTRWVAIVLALPLVACRTRQDQGAAGETSAAAGSPDTSAGVTAAANTAPGASTAGAAALPDTSRAPVTGLPRRTRDSVRRPHVDPPPREVEPLRTPESGEPRAASVREIIDSDALVGRRVRVTGRCLGYGANRALGPSPVTRSDWELEAHGAAIWVSGPLPRGCSATGGASETTSVVGVVRADTIPAFGNRPARARRYLVQE